MRPVSALVVVSPALMILTAGTVGAAVVVAVASPDATNTAFLPNSSPIWLADVQGPPNLDATVARIFNNEDDCDDCMFSDTAGNFGLSPMMDFPSPEEEVLDPEHPEVQAVIAQLDWSKVPDAPQRSLKAPGELDMTEYDDLDDPDCWWSSTVCKDPKQAYVPPDISYCPRLGDWGLNYDDGPFQDPDESSSSSAPLLYDLLASRENQKATLFYIGSNVIKYPEVAQRALSDGHTICSHTWSHPLMTTLTNEGIVAELYWTQKAIKAVLGVTPKCWRPPFGDVDDRVRAIAWQMGMRTFLWDQDSNDWSLSSSSSSDKSLDHSSSIDRAFVDWIHQGTHGTHGHITLQHESILKVSERWLPKLQKHFHVMTIHQCLNDPHPYWEDNWVYPTLDHQPEPVDSDVPIVAAAATAMVHVASVDGNTWLNRQNPVSPPPQQQQQRQTNNAVSSIPFTPLCILMFNVATSATFYWR